MSAVATGGKPGAQRAVQLTFPAVFQAQYAADGIPQEYMPTVRGPMPDVLVGDDEMAAIHVERKRDADRMARAKVGSTKSAQKKMLLSHQNYFGMPAPVLSQRVYGNPTTTAEVLNTARISDAKAPFHYSDAEVSALGAGLATGLTGGVLRSAEGQGYARNVLLRRVKQLDDIEAAKAAFIGATPLGAAPTEAAPSGTMAPSALAPTATARLADQTLAPAETTEKIGETPKIEINFLLQSILDALSEGFVGTRGREGESVVSIAVSEPERGMEHISNSTAQTGLRVLTLLLRVSPSSTGEEITEWRTFVSNIVQQLNSLTDPDRLDAYGDREARIIAKLTTMKVLFEKLGQYLDKMAGSVNLQPRERLALSKNLVKTLGFSKPFQTERDIIANAFINRREQEAAIRRNFPQFFDGGDEFPGFPRPPRPPRGDDDEPGDDDLPPRGFARPAAPREAYEARARGPARFDVDERQDFGYNSGVFYPAGGRDEAAWFGEAAPPAEARALEEEADALVEPGAGEDALGRLEGEPRVARPKPEGGLSRFFDPDTQAFNVGSTFRPVSRASTVVERPPARPSAPAMAVKHGVIGKKFVLQKKK